MNGIQVQPRSTPLLSYNSRFGADFTGSTILVVPTPFAENFTYQNEARSNELVWWDPFFHRFNTLPAPWWTSGSTAVPVHSGDSFLRGLYFALRYNNESTWLVTVVDHKLNRNDKQTFTVPRRANTGVMGIHVSRYNATDDWDMAVAEYGEGGNFAAATKFWRMNDGNLSSPGDGLFPYDGNAKEYLYGFNGLRSSQICTAVTERLEYGFGDVIGRKSKLYVYQAGARTILQEESVRIFGDGTYSGRLFGTPILYEPHIDSRPHIAVPVYTLSRQLVAGTVYTVAGKQDVYVYRQRNPSDFDDFVLRWVLPSPGEIVEETISDAGGVLQRRVYGGYRMGSLWYDQTDHTLKAGLQVVGGSNRQAGGLTVAFNPEMEKLEGGLIGWRFRGYRGVEDDWLYVDQIAMSSSWPVADYDEFGSPDHDGWDRNVGTVREDCCP